MSSYLKNTTIKEKKMEFPIYFPDATRGFVRSCDSCDLENQKVEGVVVNTYHLMSDPGTKVIQDYGGIKGFMNWGGFVTTDSGGWQIFSMIQKSKELGEVTDAGVKFFVGSKGNISPRRKAWGYETPPTRGRGNILEEVFSKSCYKKSIIFTPEASIEMQFNLQSDIVVCLDDFTSPTATTAEIEQSVKRTIDWAGRCKDEFNRQVNLRELTPEQTPILLAPIQGGFNRELRQKCASELLNIGFGAYGLGGWPIDATGKMDMDLTKFIAELTPDNIPRFALGVGFLQDIVSCVKLGWHIFDCVIPTRDARHGRLFIFNQDPNKTNILEEPQLFGQLYINKEKNIGNKNPISKYCDCHTCQNYSIGYLRHLFFVEDPLAFRLATLHNIRMYTKAIELLRKAV